MGSVLEFAPTPSLRAVVEVLEDAVGTVADLVGAGWPESVSAEDLLDATARLPRIASRARAVAVIAAAEVRDGGVARVDGFTATTRWLEVRSGLSPTESRAVAGRGEKPQWEFPSTRDAWLAGLVSEGAVREITTGIPRALKALPDTDYAVQRERLETIALRVARSGATFAPVRTAIERASCAGFSPTSSDTSSTRVSSAASTRSAPTSPSPCMPTSTGPDSAARSCCPASDRSPSPSSSVARILCDAEIHPILTGRLDPRTEGLPSSTGPALPVHDRAGRRTAVEPGAPPVALAEPGAIAVGTHAR